MTAPTEAPPVTGPLSFGQLSVWRDVELFPPEGRHQANITRIEPLGGTFYPDQIEAAFARVRRRHEGLRTTYELAEPERLRQVVRSVDAVPAPVTQVPVPPGADPDAVAAATAAELGGQPFDLATEEPWRLAVVVSGGGRASHLVLILHHIAADHWAEDLIENDLKAALAGQPAAVPAGSPLELARAQHGPAWRERRAAAEGHLRGVYTAAARGGLPPVPLAPTAAVKANLRSWTGLAGAAATAAALRARAPSLSLPSVVLAAYCHTVHRTTGVPTLLVNAMAANRVHAGTPTMVSSMNQWARIVSHHVPGEPFAEYVLRLHADSLAGYRHGCYDVDLDVALRREAERVYAPIGAEVCFNFVQSTATPDEDDRHPPERGWLLRHLPAAFLGGPAFYLVASQGHRLELTARTRWRDFDDAAMADFLAGVHDLVVPAATPPGTAGPEGGR